MNAYEKSVALGLTGTDAEKVVALRSTGLTARAIKLDELLFALNNRGMLVRLIRPADTGEKWSGTVVNMVLYINDNGKADKVFAVNQWFSHITNDRNNSFDTTQVAFSSAFWELSQALAGGPGMPSAEDFAAIATLGGGWLYANLTEVEFAAQRTAAIEQAAIELAAQQLADRRQALQERFNTIKNQVGTTEQPLAVAALQAMATELM